VIGLFCLLLLAPAAAPQPDALPPAEPLGFQARADRSSVRLGQPFGYTVEIRHRPEERYALHGQPALAPFRADLVRCRRELVKSEAVTTCTMQLALFALGPVEVPELTFDVEGGSRRAQLAVPGPRITGVGVLDPARSPDAIPLRDIAPPVALFVPSYRLLWWAAGIAGAVALALLAARLVRRAVHRRSRVPEISPRERLARRLEALEAERLALSGRGAELVARLSEAVREYLGAVTDLNALDLTSAELLAALSAAPDPRVDLQGLERFLASSDLVKFARQPAGSQECAAALEYVRGLLSRAAACEAVPPAGAGEAA